VICLLPLGTLVVGIAIGFYVAKQWYGRNLG
jgi:uncharacterized protein YneF (UPF0154 family)